MSLKNKIVIFISLLTLPCINSLHSIDITISYSILTHNETSTLKNLLELLISNKNPRDEIVIVDDFSTNPETLKILKTYSGKNNIRHYKHALNFDFAQQRNYAKSLCKGDYIFAIDADELPAIFVVKNLREILKSKGDGYLLPIFHIVENLPERFPMRVNKKGWLGPFHILRIFKNIPVIKWVHPVHEVIHHAKNIIKLPMDSNEELLEKYAFIEKKKFEKWNNSHMFYLECYKKWLTESFKNKNIETIKGILLANPHAHLTFLQSPEINNILKKLKHFTLITQNLQKILLKSHILLEDINELINFIFNVVNKKGQ